MSLEAMKQALQGLEAMSDWDKTYQVANAIQALRQAIRHAKNHESLRLAAWGRIQELEDKLDAVNMTPDRVDETAKGEHEPVAWVLHRELFWPSEYEVICEAGDNAIPLYTAPPKKEWIRLTTAEVIQCQEAYYYDTYVNIEAKLRDKNS